MPPLKKRPDRELTWKRITKEAGVEWSNHYLRNFRDPEKLREFVSKIKIKHQNGIITLASFEERFGLPQNCLSNERIKGLLPKPAIKTNNTTAYDFRQMFELLRTPQFQLDLLTAQKVSNPRARFNENEIGIQIIKALKQNGIWATK